MAGPVNLAPEDKAFVEEFRDWLADHLVGEFATARGVGGPVDDTAWELRLEWERLLAKGRWLNASWPSEYGGRGASMRQELLFHIEHADAGAPYWVGIQGRDNIGPTLLEFGTPEQRDRFLPTITAAAEFWGQGFSEPDAGSDLAGLNTRAERDGDDWVVNGQKTWVTFGERADWFYVLCRTDPTAPKHAGISMLLIPRRQSGIEVRKIRNLAGGTEFCEVFFAGARTTADLVVGRPGQGWKVAMATLSGERGGATVLPYQARFGRELDEVIGHARTLGLTRHPVVRQRIASAWANLRIMQLNNDRLMTAVLDGNRPGPESSIGKLFWANWHRSFGELAMSIAGPASQATGASEDMTVQSTFLNSRAETIYGGSNEIQRNIVAERVLALPRDPRL